jgi:rubredoxin
MGIWTCGNCGWSYDPATGDPEHGVAPGMPFEDLPGDWRCPDCGAAKSVFEYDEE